MVGPESKVGMEAAEEAKKVFDNIRKCPTCGKKHADLTITDVPRPALSQFKRLANEEFKPRGGSAHYGFTLKFLLDFYLGKIVDGASVAQEMATESLNQIAEIKSAGTEKEKDPKVKKMVDGQERRCF